MIFMKFLLKVHDSSEGKIVAVCDKDLLNKVFSNNIEITSNFYNGNLAELDEVLKVLNESFTANIIGNEIIEELIKREIIIKENVKEIDNVKYTLFFKI